MRLLEFKEADKTRLLDIILPPESSDEDFHDAVALLSVARGEWGYGRENDQIAVELRKSFSSETLSNNRKLSILETMRNDRSLLPIAEHIISDTNSPSHFRHPISNSRECISGAADCAIWLLQIGELVSDWQFVALEGAAILAAVWLSLRRLQPFN